MTTSTIETLADIGQIAGGDANVKAVLRRAVVPDFLTLTGETAWRRRTAAISCVIATKAYSLASDFGVMKEIRIGPTFDQELEYIGEDPKKLIAAEADTTNAAPYGWYYPTPTPPAKVLAKLSLNCPPDQAYTLRYVYFLKVPFADDTTDFDLDPYIPPEHQWALVAGLQRWIYFLRFGSQDNRYQVADQEYQRWVGQIAAKPEQAARNYAVYVR